MLPWGTRVFSKQTFRATYILILVSFSTVSGSVLVLLLMGINFSI